MNEFSKEKEYYFDGNITLIDDFIEVKSDDKRYRNKKNYLGKFIEYIGMPYVSDWLFDGKAKFEFGTISRGYYDNIFVLSIPE
jgi:hypothetical protein